VSPEALRAARRDAREGLAWLGRRPEVRPSMLLRVVRVLARAVFFGILRFRVERSGREHIPATGGYLLVGAVHRGWMDPFLVLHALPVAPRAWFLGSAASAFDKPWKERLLRRLGGMLPVWRGGVGVDQHLASARAVLDAGGVFVLFPEGGVAGPPDRPATLRLGAALIALRTGAPILPFAMAGTQELYVGRRMASRVLPATSARGLLGLGADDALPAAGSREELELARRLTERFAELLAPPVLDLAGGADAANRGRRRWLRGLTWLFLARPRPGRM
jgi:1-acyl-sn-glycerol-3-phosphate acyltransferase